MQSRAGALLLEEWGREVGWRSYVGGGWTVRIEGTGGLVVSTGLGGESKASTAKSVQMRTPIEEVKKMPEVK